MTQQGTDSVTQAKRVESRETVLKWSPCTTSQISSWHYEALFVQIVVHQKTHTISHMFMYYRQFLLQSSLHLNLAQFLTKLPENRRNIKQNNVHQLLVY